MYKGIATLSDGKTITMESDSIMECACWADNLARDHKGEITIKIKLEEERHES